MRVAVVTESFLPQINGVTNSVLRVCEQLCKHGHEALVVAPGSGPTEYAGARVVRTASIPLPGNRDFRLAMPCRGMLATLRDFKPDVIHLASPTVLGAQGAFVARRLGVPAVAIYQTDLAGFASRYGFTIANDAVWSWLRTVHGGVARTLAPSRHAVQQLHDNGIERVARWARGVDLHRFHPQHRDPSLTRELAPDGRLLVGYVGRLAHEKEVGLLSETARLPGVALVVVGDGPARRQLERALPTAAFLGFQSGAQLAATFASLDVFVHTGSHETFCQAAQEALASGVPVVAPAAGGLLDLVEPGLNGLSFTPGSAAELADCVDLLRRQPDARRALAAYGRRSVEGRSWDVVGRELMQHYREVA
jgi:phosphatidylinositol alpha 1,6-mannosyltransferase